MAVWPALCKQKLSLAATLALQVVQLALQTEAVPRPAGPRRGAADGRRTAGPRMDVRRVRMPGAVDGTAASGQTMAGLAATSWRKAGGHEEL